MIYLYYQGYFFPQIMVENLKKARHLEAKSFRIIFEFTGLNMENIKQIAQLAIGNSQIRQTHEISYWKISSKDQGCGIILLKGKNKWRRQKFPNFSFELNNQFIQPSAEVFAISEFKMRRTSIEINCDYILKDLVSLPYLGNIKQSLSKSRSKSKEKNNKLDALPKKICKQKGNEIQNDLKKKVYPDKNEKLFQLKQDNDIKSLKKIEKITESQVENKFFQFNSMEKIIELDDSNQEISEEKNQNKQTLNCQLLNTFGNHIPLQVFQAYIQLLSQKYVLNKNVGLIGDYLLSSLLLQNEDEVNFQIQQTKKMKVNFFLLPFLYNNHTSLLIYSRSQNQIFHIDSKMKFKSHIQILKSKLLKLSKKFQSQCDQNKYQLFDEEEIWDRIKVIECPEQPYEIESSVCCLKNIHEFLIHDRLNFNLQKKYSSSDIIAYKQFIKTCLQTNEINNA